MSEAATLAGILRDMCEGGGEEMGVDIYAIGYEPADGDVYVIRAAQLLKEQAAQITELEASLGRVKRLADESGLYGGWTPTPE